MLSTDTDTSVMSLPDAPGLSPAAKPLAAGAPAAGPQAAGISANTPTGSLSGQVLDPSGAAVAGAHVQLFRHDTLDERTMQAAADGSFTFTNLKPDRYRMTVEARGMGTYVSAELEVYAGKDAELSEITLAVGPTTDSVNVTATDVEIADAEVKEQERQRVLGVLPNFYTSYIWDAAPLDPRQKFSLVRHSLTDPLEFLAVGIRAGISQARNTHPSYHQGAEGYARRYGAAFADSVIGRTFSDAVYPVLFRQDPRYFYRGSGSTGARLKHALLAAVTARGDSGHIQPNYSFVLGSLTRSAISLSYTPHAGSGAGLVFRNTGVSVGTLAVSNVIREFVLRKLVRGTPAYKLGKPPDPVEPKKRGTESPTPKL
jgi:hypothetical protein